MSSSARRKELMIIVIKITQHFVPHFLHLFFLTFSSRFVISKRKQRRNAHWKRSSVTRWNPSTTPMTSRSSVRSVTWLHARHMTWGKSSSHITWSFPMIFGRRSKWERYRNLRWKPLMIFRCQRWWTVVDVESIGDALLTLEVRRQHETR